MSTAGEEECDWGGLEVATTLTRAPRAGAHWRTHAERSAEEECAWDVETYRAWKAVVEREGEERARRVRGVGVGQISSFFFCKPLGLRENGCGD